MEIQPDSKLKRILKPWTCTTLDWETDSQNRHCINLSYLISQSQYHASHDMISTINIVTHPAEHVVPSQEEAAKREDY
jgi:hypothetical protein